ncbi:hypothetical protein O181_014920 [Austropuccinia psidii MF-1]|uniref:Uncharacterized protein n=1 Tax=Austropuccinia psidii MF-1 TaxID=1389203 RepID=A0A9Q3C1V8_9BASI|nr:hypothetical protein [Austropuccinia psidii MF-1]
MAKPTSGPQVGHCSVHGLWQPPEATSSPPIKDFPQVQGKTFPSSMHPVLKDPEVVHIWHNIPLCTIFSQCHNYGNSPPLTSVWHIKPQSFYGQLALSITSGQYGHVIVLWTIYGHLSFGDFMALHLNPEAIEAIYDQLGISGHFPQNQGKWPKWNF